MERVTTYLPHALWLRFRAACVLQNISASKQLTILIQQFIDQQGKQS